MNAPDRTSRSVAWLRLYAEKVRAGIDVTFDIPNTRASTLEDIAAHLDSLAVSGAGLPQGVVPISDLAIIAGEIRKSADRWAQEAMEAAAEGHPVDGYEAGHCHEAQKWADYITAIAQAAKTDPAVSGAGLPDRPCAPSSDALSRPVSRS